MKCENQSYFVQNLQSKLYRTKLKKDFNKFIFICIGSNKINGDCFGPLVGENLSKKLNSENNIEIYGTIKKPVHYLNINKILKIVQEEKVCTISIDSAFSNNEYIGETYVNWGGIKLGEAFEKTFLLPTDINIKTVIAENKNNINKNFKEIFKLNENEIKKLSLQVADDIYNAIKTCNLVA